MRRSHGSPAKWTTLGGYFEAVERAGIAVNVASYAGLDNVWQCVMGTSFARPSAAELEQALLRVAPRLLDYPAWRVEVNRKTVTPEHAESNGQMIVALGPGTQRITARFVRTPDRTLGSTISLLGVLTLLALLNAGGVRLLSASP